MTAVGSAEDFWALVDKSHGPESCWEWQGSRYGGYCALPYGQCYWQPEKLSWGAHRIAWLLTYGKQPSDRLVLHWCDNPPCCNPRHLWLGTHQMNTQHAILKGRHDGPRRFDHWGSAA